MQKVILWGVGDHVKKIINQYKISEPIFEMVVDSNYEQKDSNWLEYKIQSPDMISKACSDLIVIGSELYRDEIEKSIRKMHPDKKFTYIDNYLIERYSPKSLQEQAINHPWQWFGGKSYAQHGDDLFVINLFNNMGKKKFSYLDIGAHNPYIISNTALFYQMGCRGINVEANPNLIENFYIHRPEDTNLNIGIGVENGNMPFYMIDKFSGLNSFSKEVIQERINSWGMADTKISTINIPVITLEKLIEKYCNGVFPDFLSIDIEGLDYDVLSIYNLRKNGPIIIDVEIMGDIGYKMQNMLENQGYKAAFRCGSGLIFIKEELFYKAVFKQE